MSDERERLSEAFRQLVWYIDFELVQNSSPDMTIREARERITAKRQELGLTPEALAPYAGEDGLNDWEQEVGMAMDNKELFHDELHWDLPMGYFATDEYRPMLDEENAWEDAHPDASPEEQLAARKAIVAKYLKR